MLVAAVRIHHPHFPLPGPVGQEGNLRAIGRPGRGGVVPVQDRLTTSDCYPMITLAGVEVNRTSPVPSAFITWISQ